MTNIDKYLKEFEDFSQGHLSEQEKVAFEEKLATDQEMQGAWKEYQSIMKALSDKESVSLRVLLNRISSRDRQGVKIHKLSNSLWFRLSAAAMFIVFIGCLLYFFCTKRNQEFATNDGLIDTLIMEPGDSNTLVFNDTNPAIVKENQGIHSPQIASIYDDDRYQIAPTYAELLHNVYRSNWFRLTSPEDSVLFSQGDSITFSWESNIYEPLYFDILDRHGSVIYRKTNPIQSPWTFKPILDPAIYMYRFSTKDQPVWMGVMVGR
ncbi:MAG: hypothetical protein V2I47_01410 [Bacteroidales bacterium]|jgi:hypothetical protein|nr:hypothetical protein [Bacteroidales bacterium]